MQRPADDKASYRLSVTTDSDYTVVATGRRTAATPRAGRTTWVFEEPTPTASYLVSLAIGRLVEHSLPGSGDRVALVAPRTRAIPSDSPLRWLPAMLEACEGWFGPYPLHSFRAVVVDDVLEIPLEAQGMASFGTNHLADGWDNERLVVHELAHQWFGNAATAAHLSDIWLHEGFACYAEWLWSDARGLGSVDEHAARQWRALPLQRQATPLSDPTMPHMFDDWVYKRGALTLHALRVAIGSAAFFEVCRTWVADHSVVTTAGFVDHVARVTGTDQTGLLASWLDEVALPPCPVVGAR